MIVDEAKRVALVYLKDPLAIRDGMDLIRWHSLAVEFYRAGFYVELLSPVGGSGETVDGVPFRNIETANWESYSAIFVQTTSCIDLVPNHPNTYTRVGRVVTEDGPTRIAPATRKELVRNQERVAMRSKRVIVTSLENAERWAEKYPKGASALVIPNGCPAEIPQRRHSPFPQDKNVLYLGSLSSPRFAGCLNDLGSALKHRGINLHHVGRQFNEPYATGRFPLDPGVINIHGSFDERDTWDFLYSADVGVAFASGPEPFDSEISKIYYYLRVGLPVIAEEGISNSGLISETGWGAKSRYNDIDDMVDKILAWLSMPHNIEVAQYMATEHSWKSRLHQYLALLRE